MEPQSINLLAQALANMGDQERAKKKTKLLSPEERAKLVEPTESSSKMFSLAPSSTSNQLKEDSAEEEIFLCKLDPANLPDLPENPQGQYMVSGSDQIDRAMKRIKKELNDEKDVLEGLKNMSVKPQENNTQLKSIESGVFAKAEPLSNIDSSEENVVLLCRADRQQIRQALDKQERRQKMWADRLATYKEPAKEIPNKEIESKPAPFKYFDKAGRTTKVFRPEELETPGFEESKLELIRLLETEDSSKKSGYQ